MVPGSLGRAHCCRGTLTGVLALWSWDSPCRRRQGNRKTRDTKDPQKPAWQWTTEERLAKRFDPETMKSRAASEAAEQERFVKSFPSHAADFPKAGPRRTNLLQIPFVVIRRQSCS